jgi:hypothetical protein
MTRQLIFGIGMGKSGTRSLAAALEILGHSCVHDSARVSAEIKADQAAGRPMLSRLIESNTAFCDYPIWRYFKELDRAYPGSRFILTVRDLEPWLQSRKAQIEYRLVRHRRGEPNVPSERVFNEAKERKRYAKHHAAIAKYFRGREDDVLSFSICDGEGWEVLCPFLGVPQPTVPFPWKNRSADRA